MLSAKTGRNILRGHNTTLLLTTTCVAFCVWSGAALGQTVTSGPYMQIATPTSVVVVWRTDSPTDSRVRYGDTATKLDRDATISTKVTHHELTVSNLTPGKRYYYSVGTVAKALAGGTTEHFFRGSPAPGATRVRFWVAGDSRAAGSVGMAYTKKVTEAMLAYTGEIRPALFLHTGDMANSGQDSEFQSMFFAPYAKVLGNTVCWPALGNHDIEPGTSPAYYKVYALPKAGQAGGVSSGTESYYSFDHANVHFVVLNSETEDLGKGKAMLTWLAKDLAATKQTWIVAHWHHPPYAKWGHDSDNKVTDLPMVQMRENAVPILEAAGADLLFFGHSHVYSRTALVAGAHETPTPTDVSKKVLNSGDGSLLGTKGPYVKTGKAGAVYVVAGHGGTDLHEPPAKRSPPGKNHPLTHFAEKHHGSCVVSVDRNVLRLVNLRSDGKISDRFTMVKGKALVLAEPDGGQTLTSGTKFTIRWAFVGTPGGPVKLELSMDGGATWSTIAASVATSSYSWTVPLILTSRALVRVTSAADPKLTDRSDSLISIGVDNKIVASGATWSYSDDGTDHKAAWLAAGFDHSKWKSGPGQLGYGDSDESTVLTDADPNHPSVYFLKQVTIPAAVESAKLSVVHDDGAAVWVNGAQVFSKYVANGTGHSAWASQGSEDNELSSSELKGADVKAFKIGKNAIAVMVKQVNGTSSDLSFDLALTVTYTKKKPVFEQVLTTTEVEEQKKLTFTVLASHPAQNPLTYSTGKLPAGAAFDATSRTFSWTPAAGTAGDHAVTFFATDPVGQQGSLAVTIKVTPPAAKKDGYRDGFVRLDGPGREGQTHIDPSPCLCGTTTAPPPAGLALLLALALIWLRRRGV